jgi:hypothetical protein
MRLSQSYALPSKQGDGECFIQSRIAAGTTPKFASPYIAEFGIVPI